MRLQNLANKTVCVLGYGREGKAMVQVLEQHVPSCEITIADSNESLEVPNTKHWLQVGSGWLQNLGKFDVLIVSPGIPPQPELDAVAEKCTNSTDIFLSEAKANHCLVVGVTGSKGKSTVSSLLAHVLDHCLEAPVHLVGNIGEPSIAHLGDMKPGAVFVLEISSYQLLRVNQSPTIAAVTSFFPDHLDYHGKEQDVRDISDNALHHTAAITAYKRAKKRLVQFQTDGDFTFFDGFTEGAADIAAASGGMTIETYASDSPVAIEDTKLIGQHNLRNIGLVRCIAEQLGCELGCISRAVQSFEGLAHRLQSLGVHHNAEWIDDAISTTPESAIAAIEAVGPNLKIGIFGGLDRESDFTKLGESIVQSSLEHIVLFPESGKRIKAAIEQANSVKKPLHFYDANDMKTAVAYCKQVASEYADVTPIVLLSTASASYNMFKNFEAKGEEFEKYVTEE